MNDVQYKPVPRFDSNTVASPNHMNASSDAIYQLQTLVHELRAEVAALKATAEEAPAKKPAAASSKSTTK